MKGLKGGARVSKGLSMSHLNHGRVQSPWCAGGRAATQSGNLDAHARGYCDSDRVFPAHLSTQFVGSFSHTRWRGHRLWRDKEQRSGASCAVFSKREEPGSGARVALQERDEVAAQKKQQAYYVLASGANRGRPRGQAPVSRRSRLGNVSCSKETRRSGSRSKFSFVSGVGI